MLLSKIGRNHVLVGFMQNIFDRKHQRNVKNQFFSLSIDGVDRPRSV